MTEPLRGWQNFCQLRMLPTDVAPPTTQPRTVRIVSTPDSHMHRDVAFERVSVRSACWVDAEHRGSRKVTLRRRRKQRVRRHAYWQRRYVSKHEARRRRGTSNTGQQRTEPIASHRRRWTHRAAGRALLCTAAQSGGDALRRSSLIDRQGNKAPLLENKGRITCDGGSRGERPRPPYTSMRAASSLSLEHALVV